MESSLVSIIVLTYNKYDNLRYNLESIMIQDYPDIEIIISDDGSENFDINNIKAIVKDVNYRNLSVRILHNEKNVGTIKNYMHAYSVSSGKYVFELAQDDCFYESNSIAKIVNFIEKNDYKFVAAKRIGIKSETVLPEEEDICLLDGSIDKIIERLFFSNFISGACFYFTREAYEEMGGYDDNLRLVEDYSFILKLVLNNNKIGFLDSITIKYGESGVSSNNYIGQPAVVKDSIYTIEKYVVPNMHLVRNKKRRRFIQCKLLLLKGNICKMKLLEAIFLYFDIILILVFYLGIKKKSLTYLYHHILV